MAVAVAGTALPTVPPTTQPTATTARPAARTGLPYSLLGIAHDDFCPGEYILGQVLNASGAPVAGARVAYVDQWGNRDSTTTKSTPSDFGNYDFPVGARARDFYLTVVDDAGNPLSETIFIQHRKGVSGDYSCHHVVWIGTR